MSRRALGRLTEGGRTRERIKHRAGLTGAVLILGAAVVSELPEKQTVKKE